MERFYFVVNLNASLTWRCSVSPKFPSSNSWKFDSTAKTTQCILVSYLDGILRNAIAAGLRSSSHNLILVDSVQIIRSKTRDNGLRVRQITSRRFYSWLAGTVLNRPGPKSLF